MPVTLTGLVVFIVLLLPGFAYLVGKERNGAERRTSPFRETVAIAAASVTSELTVLVLFAVVRGLRPSVTPDVGELIRHGSGYLRGSDTQPGHYLQVAEWATGMLLLAVAVAYFATWPTVRHVFRRLSGPYPHDSTVSAWWMLFERWAGGRDVEAICTLDDGSSIRGVLGSFNVSADDSPDREMILVEPISYRPPGESEMCDYDVGAVCISAHRIVTMFVNYSDAQKVTSSVQEGSSAAVGQAAGPSMVAVRSSASAL